jgi:hypothetical protein
VLCESAVEAAQTVNLRILLIRQRRTSTLAITASQGRKRRCFRLHFASPQMGPSDWRIKRPPSVQPDTEIRDARCEIQFQKPDVGKSWLHWIVLIEQSLMCLALMMPCVLISSVQGYHLFLLRQLIWTRGIVYNFIHNVPGVSITMSSRI